MKIGVIGAGNIGTGVGKRLARKGHQVVVSFARTPEKLELAALNIGSGTRGTSVEDAADFGAVVILATPWVVTLELLLNLAPKLTGKVVWDTTNPLKPDMSGLAVNGDNSAGEEIARAVPNAYVVKAIPPFAELLNSPSTRISGKSPGVFVCGDHQPSKDIVLSLIADIDADGVDAGPLTNSRYTESLGMLLVQLAYAKGMGSHIGALLLRDQV